MIIGTGIDVIEIKRIQKAMERTPTILQRLFTHQELCYFSSRNYKKETIAANFAAKEAVLKAFGTGLRGMSWTDIEVIRDEQGAPKVNLYGKAKEMASRLGIVTIHISLSHSKEYAVASVICEGITEIKK